MHIRNMTSHHRGLRFAPYHHNSTEMILERLNIEVQTLCINHREQVLMLLS